MSWISFYVAVDRMNGRIGLQVYPRLAVEIIHTQTLKIDQERKKKDNQSWEKK